DLTFSADVTVPLLKDVSSQAPKAVCEVVPTYVSGNLIINPKTAPFPTRTEFFPSSRETKDD
ncbi:MAG: hypothetical protein L0312_01840, partial [Acidobacteria bacterium]|nr:hypothetical protein [Acidobacteriota bacterium]